MASTSSEHIESVLELLRSGWKVWDDVPGVDAAADVADAATWLRAELADMPASKLGIYLGLTEGTDGYNVEIAGASGDVSEASAEWNVDWYGGEHLIGGLVTISRVHRDHVIPLAYSGAVLATALETLPPTAICHRRLAMWGFHDGDLFLLGRFTPSRFERIMAQFVPQSWKPSAAPKARMPSTSS